MVSTSIILCGFAVLAALSATAAWAAAAGPAGAASASVTIDTRAPAVAYSPWLFGGFIEHFGRQVYGGLFEPGSPLADERGFRRDVVAAMKELKLAVLRWPGGCFVSGYRWEDGVGRERKPTPDPVWGTTDPNTFGTDEFVAWCRLVGCEPYICTNAGDGTPEEMARWVEYCNAAEGAAARRRAAAGHAEPLNVRTWSIGNENWGGHEIGTKTAQQWGPFVRRCAEAMLAADGDLVLTAAATPKADWTLPLLASAGEHLDYVAIHRYWIRAWKQHLTPGYLECIMHSEGPEAGITGVIGILEKAGCRGRVKIAFDEWNLRGWHHPGFPRKAVSDPADPAVADLIGAREKNAIASQYTMADALFSASFLNASLRHAGDVGMTNIAPIVNTRGPLFVHPGGIVKRTTFHTLAMYANDLQPRVAKLDLQAPALVHGRQSVGVLDAVATVDAAGRNYAIALIHRHPSAAIRCTLRIGDTLPDGQYPATVLAGDSPDAYNDIAHPGRVTPEKTTLTLTAGRVTLSPHSLTILKIALP